MSRPHRDAFDAWRDAQRQAGDSTAPRALARQLGRSSRELHELWCRADRDDELGRGLSAVLAGRIAAAARRAAEQRQAARQLGLDLG